MREKRLQYCDIEKEVCPVLSSITNFSRWIALSIILALVTILVFAVIFVFLYGRQETQWVLYPTFSLMAIAVILIFVHMVFEGRSDKKEVPDTFLQSLTEEDRCRIAENVRRYGIAEITVGDLKNWQEKWQWEASWKERQPTLLAQQTDLLQRLQCSKS